MEKIILKFVEANRQAGNRYICKLTEELDDIFKENRAFKLCKKSNEPIIRIEYKNRSIGDLLVINQGTYSLEIKKHSLYMANITCITELNKNSIINAIHRILQKYNGSSMIIK